MSSSYHIDQHMNIGTKFHPQNEPFDQDKENEEDMLNYGLNYNFASKAISHFNNSSKCINIVNKDKGGLEKKLLTDNQNQTKRSQHQNQTSDIDIIARPSTRIIHKIKTPPIRQPISPPPSVLIAPKEEHYFSSGFVHCCVIREVNHPNGSSNTRYRFIFQTPHGGGNGMGSDERNTAMIAEKQQHNMTSNYHIFDTTRLPPTSSLSNIKLNKKAGNYIGKLRKCTRGNANNASGKNHRISYSLFDAKSGADKEEIAAIVYEKPSLFQQWKDGLPPRKLKFVTPHVDDDGKMEKLPPYLTNRMVESIERNISTGLRRFESKVPTFEKDQYRLNFNGRVSFPSVKNMQIIDEVGEEMFAQYGKVGENRFHLDYKYPLNALQAFGLALTAMDF